MTGQVLLPKGYERETEEILKFLQGLSEKEKQHFFQFIENAKLVKSWYIPQGQ